MESRNKFVTESLRSLIKLRAEGVCYRRSTNQFVGRIVRSD